MALPLVLGAVGVGIIGSLLNEADNNNERATRMNARAFNRMGEAKRSLAVQNEKMRKALIKLSNRKKGIMHSSIKKFVNLYEQIINVVIDNQDEELKALCSSFQNDSLASMREMVNVSGMAMTERELVVNMLFSFKHGGIVGSILKDSEINVQVASMRKRQANTIAAQSENEEVILKGIYEQAEAFSDLLAKLNLLFIKSLQVTEEIITRNGNNRTAYNEDDYKALMTCINLAKAVKTVVDAPLFEENGEISQAVQEAMLIGQKYLNAISEQQ